MAHERECPVYATTQIKTLGLDNDAIMVMMLAFAVSNELIGGGTSLVLSWLTGYLIQRKADKSGLPSGFLQYKVAALSGHPFVMKYISFVSTFLAKPWRIKGSIPPAGMVKRYSR